MSKPLKITALLLLFCAGGYGLSQCQNRAAAPVVPPLADSPYRPAADARDDRVAAPEVTPEQYAALQQQVVACTPQLQQRQKQHEHEQEQKLTTAFRELLQQGQSITVVASPSAVGKP